MSHPPIANGVVCVDFDGTIVPWGPLDANVLPKPSIVQAIRRLKDAGYHVVVFTSRLSPEWLMAEFPSSPLAGGISQLNYVHKVLETAGIPFDRLTSEKVPAEVYFDDKAIRVDETFYPLDAAINDWLALQQRKGLSVSGEPRMGVHYEPAPKRCCS